MIKEYITVKNPFDYFDGIEWNPASPGTTLTRVGNPLYTSSHPIHKMCKPVLLLDDGSENGDLASWQAPTITGITDGSAGQCMLKIPKFYYRERFTDGKLSGLYISDYNLPGFKLHEKFSWRGEPDEIYVSLYEGYLQNGKLASISGYLPTASRTLAQYRTDATARGSDWHAYDYYTHHLLQMLFYIYYGTLNSQAALPGYTEHSWTGAEVRTTGRSNVLDTVNGYVNADETGLDSGLATGWLGTSRVVSNRFMWIENLYGHLWKFLDGCAFDGRVGYRNTAYLTSDPGLFSSTDANILAYYTNMNIDLAAATNESYIGGMGPALLPISHGGSSSTYYCDYFWSYLDDASRNYLRVVIAGGPLGNSGQAGVAARHAIYGLGIALSSFVSRVCFEKT